MTYKLITHSIYELGQRSNQEDYIYPLQEDMPSNGSLYILCDGMGGHAAGEVASKAVCETMSRMLSEYPDSETFSENVFYKALNAAYDSLDALDNEEEKKMGTTLVFAKFHSGGCFTAHIGDSRLYHIRPSKKEILHLTRDHSLVNELISLGEMTKEEAKTSRQKNVITRAIQPHQETRTKADCLNLTDIEVGDYLFLCSDGMLEKIEDKELVNILALRATDKKKIEILKNLTKNNQDNHSALLVRVEAVNGKSLERQTTGKRHHYLFFFLLLALIVALAALYYLKMILHT
ncbi:MAG: serine/threonine-protein phosphatase [Bacteroidales bacterium]|nr:serine/threonine-protein phosphatase [Bacteroidales bacterium]